MSRQLPPYRHAALRDYFRSVAGDLVTRGLVRRREGQSLESILKTEPALVLHAVSEDFAIVGSELGLESLVGLASILVNQQSPVARLIGAGLHMVAGRLKAKP